MTVRPSTVLAGIAVVILLTFYLLAAARISLIDRASPMAVLATSGESPSTQDFRIATGDARAAVILDPLNQRLVNAAMVANVRAQHVQPGRVWFDTLSELGWRDTASRQNLFVWHVLHQNIPEAINDVDGLLRRNRLIGELTPVLLAMEADPLWQSRLVERLHQRPAWRFGYLQRGSLINDPSQLAARASTLRHLQQVGDDVAEAEIAPLLPKLLSANLGTQAFAIWHNREPSIARPIADPNFADLADEREPSTVSFHWQLTAGPEYGVYAVRLPVPHLALNWNGAGAPVFATQYLSGLPGRHRVILTSLKPEQVLKSMIGVRLVCGNDAVEFARVRQISPTQTAYESDRAAPCGFPRLELFGRSDGSGLHDQQTAITHIAVI